MSKKNRHQKMKPSIVNTGQAKVPSTINVRMLMSVFPGLEQYTNQKHLNWDFSMLEAMLVVENGFLEVTEMYEKKYFTRIPIPDDIKKALYLWRVLFNRYKQGSYYHTEDERKATAELAQWTIDKKNELRGQEPEKVDLLNQG